MAAVGSTLNLTCPLLPPSPPRTPNMSSYSTSHSQYDAGLDQKASTSDTTDDRKDLSSEGQPTIVPATYAAGSGGHDTYLPSPNSPSGFSAAFDGASQCHSKPSSSHSQRPPELDLTRAEHGSESESKELGTSMSEEEDSDAEEDDSKTPAQRLAAKRRMKRFRLNHAQTRYLMNEFARQAHPDAEQRERLSRDIPGLSPRQVQVWFQNRRAKLKRLTVDDQERIVISRTLPADFDVRQTLQIERRGSGHSLSASSSTSHLDVGGAAADQRPTLRLNSDFRDVAFGSLPSIYTGFPSNTPSPTGSANHPPSPHTGSQYSHSLSPITASIGYRHPPGRSMSLSAGSNFIQPQHPLSARTSMNRMRAESIPFTEQSNYPNRPDVSPSYQSPTTALSPYHTEGIPRLQHASTDPPGLGTSTNQQQTPSIGYLERNPYNQGYSVYNPPPNYYLGTRTQDASHRVPWPESSQPQMTSELQLPVPHMMVMDSYASEMEGAYGRDLYPQVSRPDDRDSQRRR